MPLLTMKVKPEYRFECRIIDAQNDEEVISASTYLLNEKRVGEPLLGMENLLEEAVEMEVWSMLRHFRNGAQEKHEADYYQDNNEEDGDTL